MASAIPANVQEATEDLVNKGIVKLSTGADRTNHDQSHFGLPYELLEVASWVIMGESGAERTK